jgi:hypothetical protein
MAALGVCRETLLRLEEEGLLHPELVKSRLTGAMENRYPDDEVRALQKAKAQTPPTEITREGIVYIIDDKVPRMVDATPARVRTWDQQGWPDLDGEKPTIIKERPRWDLPEAGWYPKDKMKFVRKVRAKRRRKRGYYDRPDGTYALISAIKRDLHVDRKTVIRLFREGKVRRAKIRGVTGRGEEKYGYHLAWLRAALETRGAPFDGVYSDGAMNMSKASDVSGVPVPRLNKHAQLGWLKTTRRAPPCQRGRKTGKGERAVTPEALEEYLRARRQNGWPPGDWVSAPDLEEICGVRNKEELIYLGSLLRKGRESGQLEHHRPDWPILVRGGALRRVRLYRRGQALAYLAAQGIPVSQGNGQSDPGNGRAPSNDQKSPEEIPAAPSAAPVNGDAPPRRRARPAEEKHLKWKEWRDEGLSYNDIARRHERLTHEITSADTVKKALKRLASEA